MAEIADRSAGRIQYLYVCVSRAAEAPPETALSRDDLHARHVAYLQDLFDRGLLFGSGPQESEDGERPGGAVLILQNVTYAEAKETAVLEPNCREGLRTMEVIPWRRVWFGG